MNDEATFQRTPSLMRDILTHLSNLMRKEVDLARSEISENLTRAGIAVGLLVGAVVLSLTALNVLSAAAVAGIANLGIAPGWASLIVGVALAAIALGLTMKGLNDLKLSSIAPTRAAENVQRDADMIKEKLHD